MIITIHFTGVDPTPAAKNYVSKKMESISKFNTHIVKMEIDLGLRSQHHNKGKIFYAEVNVQLPKRNLRVVKDAEDLYKAVDKVRDHLKNELHEEKEKVRSRDKKVLRSVKEYQG